MLLIMFLVVLGHTFLLFWPGTAPWSGLDPSQTLRSGPGMLLDRFSGTHFGSLLMFFARLENQVWAKTWPGTPNQASRFRIFFLGPSLGLSLHIFIHFLEMPTIT